MFAPFSIATEDTTGKLLRQESPLLHWGNVETGSMVNLVYRGVLEAFPELQAYHQNFEHAVKCVGGITIRKHSEEGVTTLIKIMLEMPFSQPTPRVYIYIYIYLLVLG